MKTFRIMKNEHTNAGPVSSFAGYVIAVDIEDAILWALNNWGWGYYYGHEIPGPTPAGFSRSAHWYAGLIF